MYSCKKSTYLGARGATAFTAAHLDPQVHVHLDGIDLLGVTVGNEQNIRDFLQTKLDKSDSLLLKVD